MPISEVIRRKRKELEMTQEQVAQRLGVSAPAVNKWEKGSSYPDITLLPPLARLLETDVNTLLCFREELSEEEIGQICNEMTKLICEEGLKAGFEMAEKKIREYPNCMVLIYSLNTCLDGSLILYSANETEEELKIYQNKIIAYYEFIVSCAEEGRTREGAVYMLAGKYMNMERYDEAEEILKTLPERPADRRVLQAKLLANRGRVSEAAELLEKKVLGDSSELHLTLLKLLELAMDEGREEDARAIAQIGKQTAELYSLWGYNSTLLPSTMESAGTGFEELEFYEASSIRKINGRYYLVYSSVKSSELCYAVSDRPDGGYRFGGTLVDIGDIGYAGRVRRDAVNMLGNTHGGIEKIGEEWYVFYHRQTDRSNFSRQGCAEKIVIEPDGNIPQVEVTSCGLNGGPMRGTGTYPARICCHLTGKKPAVFSHPVSMKMDYPFLTQDVPDIEPGSEEAIREEVTPVQYIRNMCDGAVAGYKYFSFPGGENEAEALERFVCVTVRGNAHGVLRIRTKEKGESCGEISVSVCSQEWTEFKGRFRTPAGVHGLYFQYDGSGSFDLLSFSME